MSTQQPFIRLGIIGLGNAFKHHYAAIKCTSKISARHFSDTDWNTIKQFPISDIDYYSHSYRDLLNNQAINTVLVTTPVATHYEIAKAALGADKDVILEKPATLNLADLHNLATLAEIRERRLVVALHAAFGREVIWFKDYMRTHPEIGSIVAFRCGFYDPYVENGVILPHATSLAGSWLDSGINALSVIQQLLPETSFTIDGAYCTYLKDHPALDIRATVNLAYHDNKYHGHIQTAWDIGENKKKTEIYTSSGRNFILQHSTQQVLEWQNEGQNLAVIQDCARPGYDRLTEHYIGVYADILQRWQAPFDACEASNIPDAIDLHSLLFRAAAQFAPPPTPEPCTADI